MWTKKIQDTNKSCKQNVILLVTNIRLKSRKLTKVSQKHPLSLQIYFKEILVTTIWILDRNKHFTFGLAVILLLLHINFNKLHFYRYVFSLCLCVIYTWCNRYNNIWKSFYCPYMGPLGTRFTIIFINTGCFKKRDVELEELPTEARILMISLP